PSTGLHYARIDVGSLAATIGQNGDIPVAGDYAIADNEGDGRTDFAIWRPSTGLWFAANSSNLSQNLALTIGQNGDVPVPGDSNGDGKTDIGIFRPSTGLWYIIFTGSGGATLVATVGQSGDIPVPADYDADGKADIAIFRPSNAMWYSVSSINGAANFTFVGQN